MSVNTLRSVTQTFWDTRGTMTTREVNETSTLGDAYHPSLNGNKHRSPRTKKGANAVRAASRRPLHTQIALPTPMSLPQIQHPTQSVRGITAGPAEAMAYVPDIGDFMPDEGGAGDDDLPNGMSRCPRPPGLHMPGEHWMDQHLSKMLPKEVLEGTNKDCDKDCRGYEARDEDECSH